MSLNKELTILIINLKSVKNIKRTHPKFRLEWIVIVSGIICFSCDAKVSKKTKHIWISKIKNEINALNKKQNIFQNPEDRSKPRESVTVNIYKFEEWKTIVLFSLGLKEFKPALLKIACIKSSREFESNESHNREKWLENEWEKICSYFTIRRFISIYHFFFVKMGIISMKDNWYFLNGDLISSFAEWSAWTLDKLSHDLGKRYKLNEGFLTEEQLSKAMDLFDLDPNYLELQYSKEISKIKSFSGIRYNIEDKIYDKAFTFIEPKYISFDNETNQKLIERSYSHIFDISIDNSKIHNIVTSMIFKVTRGKYEDTIKNFIKHKINSRLILIKLREIQEWNKDWWIDFSYEILSKIEDGWKEYIRERSSLVEDEISKTLSNSIMGAMRIMEFRGELEKNIYESGIRYQRDLWDSLIQERDFYSSGIKKDEFNKKRGKSTKYYFDVVLGTLFKPIGKSKVFKSKDYLLFEFNSAYDWDNFNIDIYNESVKYSTATEAISHYVTTQHFVDTLNFSLTKHTLGSSMKLITRLNIKKVKELLYWYENNNVTKHGDNDIYINALKRMILIYDIFIDSDKQHNIRSVRNMSVHRGSIFDLISDSSKTYYKGDSLNEKGSQFYNMNVDFEELYNLLLNINPEDEYQFKYEIKKIYDDTIKDIIEESSSNSKILEQRAKAFLPIISMYLYQLFGYDVIESNEHIVINDWREELLQYANRNNESILSNKQDLKRKKQFKNKMGYINKVV